MVDVIHKRCTCHGCFKQSPYVSEGSRKAEVCSEQNMPGMVDVFIRQCVYPGCSVWPLYPKKGSNKVEMCRQHKTTGMVNVSMKTCASEGGAKYAGRGLDGSRQKKVLCHRHFTEMTQGEHLGVHELLTVICPNTSYLAGLSDYISCN